MEKLPGIFDMPESREELALWLEDQMCNRNFAEIIESLSIVQSSQLKEDPIELPISDDRMNAILTHGLCSLDSAELQLLLGNPRQLYLLQEEIYGRGGEYWVRKFDRHVVNSDSDTMDLVQKYLEKEGENESSRNDHITTLQEASDGVARRLPVGLSVLAALAASVLIFLGGSWFGKFQAESEFAVARKDPATEFDPNGSQAETWGWNRKNALELQLDRTNKLNHLANLLSEWNTAKIDSPQMLLSRAKELRSSCDVLLAAKLSDLPEDDVRWLKDKCRNWSMKIDQYIATLSDPKQFDAVSEELDRLVHKSVFLIRSRAKKV